MLRAKPQPDQTATPPANRGGEYRYREIDSQSVSITVLTHSLKADAKVGVSVTGVAVY
jgi:hypothetical protein